MKQTVHNVQCTIELAIERLQADRNYRPSKNVKNVIKQLQDVLDNDIPVLETLDGKVQD